jgi:hypothetical protein
MIKLLNRKQSEKKMNKKGDKALEILFAVIVLGLLTFIILNIVNKSARGFDKQITGQMCDLNNGITRKVGFNLWMAEGDCPCDKMGGYLHHYDKSRVVGAMIDKEKVPNADTEPNKKILELCAGSTNAATKFICFYGDNVKTGEECFPLNVKIDDGGACGCKYVTAVYEEQVKSCSTVPKALPKSFMKVYAGTEKDVLLEFCVVDPVKCMQQKQTECDDYNKMVEEENARKRT